MGYDPNAAFKNRHQPKGIAFDVDAKGWQRALIAEGLKREDARWIDVSQFAFDCTRPVNTLSAAEAGECIAILNNWKNIKYGVKPKSSL